LEACGTVRNDLSPQALFDVIKLAYLKAVEECIPTRTTTNHKNKQGAGVEGAVRRDRSVKHAIKTKYRLFARMRAEPSKENKSEYNRAARDVKRCVKRVRTEIENNIAKKCKREPKLLYAYINSQRKCKGEIKMLDLEDGTQTSDRTAIANTLNLTFSRSFVGQTRAAGVSRLADRTDKKCSIDPEVVFAPSNVEKYLKQLDGNKSPGNDKIHPYVIRQASSSFATILSKLYVKSYESGELPSEWKEANVTPIFKKGSKSDPNNYRPVSLTSVACKTMERMIRDVMMRHLIENDLIHKGQHGFVPGKSCTTNLLESIDFITNALHNGFLVILILLDFAKAFDTVPHEELLEKVRAYGFDEKIVKWLGDFLKRRRQRVVMGDIVTEWVEVTSGVPQGSVLGPLLFLIYINDMPDVVSSLCELYADDSKLMEIIKSEADLVRVQANIDRLVEWSNVWKMRFNPGKCKFMVFGNKALLSQGIRLTMETYENGLHELEESSEEMDLGVCLRNNLKWDENVKMACTNAYNSLGILRRTFKTWSDARTFKTLYTAFVRPHLEYAAPVWNCLNRKEIKRLEDVQKRATKLVPQLRDMCYEERLLNLGLTSLEDRRMRGDMIQMFKIERRINRVELSRKCEDERPVMDGEGPACSVIARRRSSIRIQKEFVKKCTVRERCFINRVADPWNELSNHVVGAKSVNIFKARYDKETELL
jgi:hypothetical protein